MSDKLVKVCTKVPFSDDEIRFIRENAGLLTAKDISVLLGRTLGSVRALSCRLQISMKLRINPSEKRDGRTYGVRFDANEKQQARHARLLTEVFSGKAQTLSQ